MTESLRHELETFNPDLPLERARTIPSRWYLDPAIAELERRAVFGNSWQMVGRLDSVAEPGSFLTAEIAGEPILVLRDHEGALRGFFNVCRHRAAPLLTQPCGKVGKLRCRYHGWTYDLAGRLRGVPEFDGVEDFCREKEGLVPVALGTWGGLVWVHTGPNPPPLEQFLAPLIGRGLDRWMGRLRWVERRDYLLNCNWKVFVDNYLDGGYHINTIHPGLASVVEYSRYHSVLAGETSVQISPLRQPASPDQPDVAAVRGGPETQYWWLFPNLMINLYQDVMDTNLVLPLAPDRCRVVIDFYFACPEGPETQEFVRTSIEVGHQIQAEDVGICEEVQRGLGSRSFDTGRFSVRREGPGYHFHQLLAQRLKAGL
jgi:choline monooxygenase